MSRRTFLAGGVVVTAGALAWRVESRPATQSAAPIDANSPWVVRSGSSLWLSGRKIRLPGGNMYWLGLDNNIRTAAGAPTYPTPARVDQAMSAAQHMGLRAVRAHTLGISVGQPYSVMPALGQFNDQAFAPIDYAIATAGHRGIRLMIPLIDQWRYYHGGKWVFCHWRADLLGEDTNPDLSQNAANNATERAVEANFYSNPTIISDFQGYVRHIMEHINPHTGLALKDDPTIAIWETGNELFDASSEWTATMSRFIKSLAPKALVADGSASYALTVAEMPGLKIDEIDIVGSHYFPPDEVAMQLDVASAVAAGKVYLAGEYDWTGQSAGADLTTWLSALAQSRSSGDLFWALLPYETDGKPEPSGDRYGLYDPPTSSAMSAAVGEISLHAGHLSAG